MADDLLKLKTMQVSTRTQSDTCKTVLAQLRKAACLLQGAGGDATSANWKAASALLQQTIQHIESAADLSQVVGSPGSVRARDALDGGDSVFRSFIDDTFRDEAAFSDERRQYEQAYGMAKFARRLSTVLRPGEATPFQLPPEVVPKVELAMHNIHKFDYNINEIAEKTGQPLLSVVLAAFEFLALDCKLSGFNMAQLERLLTVIESYHRQQCYHNSTHAADVVQKLVFLLFTDDVISELEPIEVAAAILSAAIHDIAHPGVSNHFLKKSKDQLSNLFGHRSAAEAAALAIGMEFFSMDECNILTGCVQQEIDRFQHLVHSMVLGTDMARHVQVCERLEGSNTSSPWTADAKDAVLCALLHTADLAGPSEPPDMAGMWARALHEEFFKQGRREIALGLEPTPFFQEEDVVICTGQIHFSEAVLLPAYESVAHIVPKAVAEMTESLKENIRLWQILRDNPASHRHAVISQRMAEGGHAPRLCIRGSESIEKGCPAVQPLLQLLAYNASQAYGPGLAGFARETESPCNPIQASGDFKPETMAAASAPPSDPCSPEPAPSSPEAPQAQAQAQCLQSGAQAVQHFARQSSGAYSSISSSQTSAIDRLMRRLSTRELHDARSMPT